MFRWEVVTGLLLSLLLNIGVLAIGVHFFHHQNTLLFDQSAGSLSDASVFTLEVVASQAGSIETQIADTVSEVDAEVAVEAVDNTLEASPAKRPEEIAGGLNRRDMAESMITTDDSSQRVPAVLDHEEIDSTRAKNNAKMPATKPKPVAELHKHERHNQDKADNQHHERVAQADSTAKNSTRKGNEVDQTASQARSGDQFANALSNLVATAIEGCYPEASKRRGEEGVVRLQVLRSSADFSVEVISGSGFSRLDRCAVSATEKAIRRLGIQEMPANGFQMKPIRFQLVQ